eukprot:1134371-Pelagomonas_calceolata.AAC.9
MLKIGGPQINLKGPTAPSWDHFTPKSVLCNLHIAMLLIQIKEGGDPCAYSWKNTAEFLHPTNHGDFRHGELSTCPVIGRYKNPSAESKDKATWGARV